MRVRLLAFASAADAVGRDTQSLDLPTDVNTIGALKRHLEKEYPELGALWHRLAIAVDGEISSDDSAFDDGSEIALLPPVSGGRPDASAVEKVLPLLCDDEIDLAAVRSAVERPEFGAVLLFVGNVRNHHQGQQVEAIHYSAYRSMAEERIARIISELSRDGGASLQIVHRLGVVAAGRASVVIAVASAHREHCYDVSRLALERLKKEVPIWKKERFADGTSTWREVEPLH